MEDIDFEETDHFQPGAIPWRLGDLAILPKTYLYEFGVVLKISARSLIP
jgi:hypothetical protein